MTTPEIVPLDAEQRARVAATTRLVEAVAANVLLHFGGTLGRDDLLALGREALVRAAQTYDARKGSSFETHAWKRIYFAMVDGIRGETKHAARREAARSALADYLEAPRDEVDLFQETEPRARARLESFSDGFAAAMALGYAYAPTTIEDELSAHEARARALAAVGEAVAALTPRERELVRLRFEEDRTLKDAGQILRVPYRSTKRMYARVLEKLGRAVLGRGVDGPPEP